MQNQTHSYHPVNAPAVIQGIFARLRVVKESLSNLDVAGEDEEIIEGIGLVHNDIDRALCEVLQFCEGVSQINSDTRHEVVTLTGLLSHLTRDQVLALFAQAFKMLEAEGKMEKVSDKKVEV